MRYVAGKKYEFTMGDGKVYDVVYAGKDLQGRGDMFRFHDQSLWTGHDAPVAPLGTAKHRPPLFDVGDRVVYRTSAHRDAGWYSGSVVGYKDGRVLVNLVQGAPGDPPKRLFEKELVSENSPVFQRSLTKRRQQLEDE